MPWQLCPGWDVLLRPLAPPQHRCPFCKHAPAASSLPEPAACTVLDLHGDNLKTNAQYSRRHLHTHKLMCLSSAFRCGGLQDPSAHCLPPGINRHPATAGKVSCKPKLYCEPATPRRVACPLLLPRSLFLLPGNVRNAPLPH